MTRNLIRFDAVQADPWVAVDDSDALPDDASADVLVTLARWQSDRAALVARGGRVGVQVPNTADVRELALEGVALVALEFPRFADGRAYSQAVILRDQLGFEGDLRATGDVLRDQLRHMRRCGFNEFALRADKDPHAALASLKGGFTVDYQGPWVAPRDRVGAS